MPRTARNAHHAARSQPVKVLFLTIAGLFGHLAFAPIPRVSEKASADVSSTSRRDFAALLAASLAATSSPASAKLITAANTAKDLDGYNLEGKGLESKLNLGFNKVKTVCEEIAVTTAGGSRGELSSTSKRYLCNTADREKEKADKGEKSMLTAAKERREVAKKEAATKVKETKFRKDDEFNR
eukprot:TRINITY_DN65020_c0_g1_i1.p1 TRINITY_DN65020_c0_g1~~TRINITY_DN65020_c0_g1_i1.p1  ORF type:complete len:183 (+),score=54.93 TRINITY_DN65020_c0_g1_i1:47-595(+)